MTSVVVQPWQIWWVDFDPTEGREQAGRRPAVVISSPLHLQLTSGLLVNVLPMTTRNRFGWRHHVRVDFGPEGSYVLTEQVRTVARNRFVGDQPAGILSIPDTAEVMAMGRRMFDWR